MRRRPPKQSGQVLVELPQEKDGDQKQVRAERAAGRAEAVIKRSPARCRCEYGHPRESLPIEIGRA